MAIRRPQSTEIRSARPIFALVVEWLGRVYRFSTMETTITDKDGREYRFSGSLDLRGYKDQMGRPGTADTGGVASLSVIFSDVNVVSEYLRGRVLEGATCELAMVFVRDGAVSTVWEDRIVLMTGAASQPQCGFPDRDNGFAAFSVVARPFDDKSPILDPAHRIGADTQPSSSVDYYGAAYPLVFGSPGDSDIPGSPGYLIKTTPGDRRVLIAEGAVDAPFVTISDEEGDQYTARSVQTDTDSRGALYSYVSVSSAPPGFANNDGKHFVHWDYNGADTYGKINPFGPSGLRKSTDILRYLLGRASTVDNAAFQAMAPVLDRYTLGGYVNDLSLSVWAFVSGQLLPLLPVHIRNGPDGLYPISLFPSLYPSQLPQLTIDPVEGLEQVSPVQITKKLRDLVNHTALSYYYNARDDRNTRELLATPDSGATGRSRATSAQRSREIYGVRAGPTIQGDYIDSDDGAQQVLRWLMYDRGFLHMAVQIQAAPRYGWLMVGDHVSLTSADLDLTGRRAVVTSKAWEGSAWRFVLSWSLNPIEATF